MTDHAKILEKALSEWQEEDDESVRISDDKMRIQNECLSAAVANHLPAVLAELRQLRAVVSHLDPPGTDPQTGKPPEDES